MPTSKVLLAERFIKALQELGALPDHTIAVTIRARVGDLVTMEYEVFAEDEIIRLAESVQETDDPDEAALPA